MRLAQMTNRMSPSTAEPNARSRVVSRMNEIFGDAGVSPEALGHRPQAERSLLPDLDEVIEESDDAEAAGQPQHEQTRGRRHGTGEQVSEQVGEDGGADDDDSAHGRGAALGRMRGRTVVTDEL